MPILEYQNGHSEYRQPTMQGFYPTYDFPPIMGDAILEVSRNLNLPVELAAQAALGAVSLACQDFINVQCPNFDPAPCSLFLMAASNSSGGKSLAEQRFLRAFSAFEHKQEEDAEAKLPIYRAELKIWLDDDRRLAKDYRNAERSSGDAQSIREERLLHEQNRPVEPTVRELRYAELSPQGLRDMLVANGAIGILSPEAGPVVNGMTFSQPAMLSGYWSGEDRPVGLAGGNRRPVEPRLTVSVMLQVAKFSDYMKSRGGDAFGTGLLGRFFVVAPESDNLPWQQTCVDEVPEPKLGLFNERVTQILNQAVPAPRERVVLRLSDGAKRYWKYFKDAINDGLNNGGYSDDIKSFFRKLAQQASRIAALFHYFEGKSGDISPKAMTSAIVLCEWYAHEYIRIFMPYSPSQQQKDTEASQKLLDWLREAVANPWRHAKLTPGRYTERDLNNYSAIRGNPVVLANAIDILHRQGCISIMYGKKNGRVIFYPPATMPPLTQQNYQAPQARSIFDLGLNLPPYTGSNNPNFGVPAQQGINRTLENMQMASALPQSGNLEQVEIDSPEIRAVNQEIQRKAMEAGIGPVEITASYRRG